MNPENRPARPADTGDLHRGGEPLAPATDGEATASSTPAPDGIAAGEMFGPYRLDEVIGRGAMGEVLRAFDTVRGRVVALKRLPAVLAANPEFRARFRAESALAARLHDPHIIPIHDYGQIDGRLFIDMRLVEGRDLGARLAGEGPMTAQGAVSVVAQLAAALDTAHAEGMIHRDVKPSNVLLVPGRSRGDEDFVYLADFGIARAVSQTSASLTLTGATVGSLEYMAPERFTGGHGDHRVDVYALGCLLFETLTARKPFVVEGLPAMMHAHLSVPPPRPSEALPGVPPALDAVVAMAMAKQPEKRYQSAGELAVAARAAVAGHDVIPFRVGDASPDGGAPLAASTTATTAASTESDPTVLRIQLPVVAPGSTAPRGRRQVLVVCAVAVALLALGGGTLALGLRGRANADEIRTDPVRTTGIHPFRSPVGQDRAGVTPRAPA